MIFNFIITESKKKLFAFLIFIFLKAGDFIFVFTMGICIDSFCFLVAVLS
jgi:hypothetical protein